MPESLPINVLKHPAYGYFSVYLQAKASDLNLSPDLETIKTNLKRLKKAKVFDFFPCDPSKPDKKNERKIFEILGIEYKNLSGFMRPVFNIHSDFLGYECEFSAIKKYEEGYDHKSKGLTKLAIEELQNNLAKDLEDKATEIRDYLIKIEISKYLQSIQDKSLKAFEYSKREVSLAQKRLEEVKKNLIKKKENFENVVKVIEIARLL